MSEKKEERRACDETPERVVALAFGGGAFDSANQLGIIHALLVLDAPAPRIVTGISAGAVTAAILAEVMAARKEADEARTADADAPDGREYQIVRFREILEAISAAPSRLLRALVPDAYEVTARRALEPVMLPIHLALEREDRGRAGRARAGLTRLFNGLLSLDVPVSEITRAVRLGLELPDIAERTPNRFKRLLVSLGPCVRLWLIAVRNVHRMATFLAHVVGHLAPRVLSVAASLVVAALAIWGLDPWRPGHHPFTRAGIWGLGGVIVVAGVLIGEMWKSRHDKPPTASDPEVVARTRKRSTVVGTLLGLTVGVGGLAVVAPSLWARGDAAKAVFAALALAVSAAGGTAGWLWKSWLPDTGRAYDIIMRWRPLAHFRAAGVAGTGLLIGYGICILAPFAAVVCWALRKVVKPKKWLDRLMRLLLSKYDLAHDLATSYFLRAFYSSLFDRDFYGKRRGESVVEAAVERERRSRPLGSTVRDAQQSGRPLSDYWDKAGIHLAPSAANIRTGKLELLDPQDSIVDALVAATSVVPAFEACKITRKKVDHYYIDGVNVANEPTWALLRDPAALRRMAKDATAIDVYTAFATPLSEPESAPIKNGPRPTPLDEPAVDDGDRLVEHALRGLELYRESGRHEREMVTAFRNVIRTRADGRSSPFLEIEDPDPREAADGPHLKTVVAVDLVRIEPARSLDVNRRVFEAESPEAAKLVIEEAVADGCRAVMERWLKSWVDATPDLTKAVSSDGHVKCALVVGVVMAADPTRKSIPGATHAHPGVYEICRACVLHRGKDGSPASVLSVATTGLHMPPSAWPVGPPKQSATVAAPAAVASKPTDKTETGSRGSEDGPAQRETVPWPVKRNEQAGTERPVVSILLAGGVFRGVFQVGVMAALRELNIRPDLVAGSSVGSISAAMLARQFSLGENLERPREDRRWHLGQVAGAFLGLDRMMITDRFGDAIRRFTLRTAEAKISLKDIDNVFRVYDAEDFGSFNRHARRVVAAIERILYLNPFDLTELVRSFRERNARRIRQSLVGAAQGFLDRYEIGDEILGAEPLEFLIQQYVVGADAPPARAHTFDAFRVAGMHLLAVSTNLTTGRMAILSSDAGEGRETPSLVDGLLASSAFPAVFRPRTFSEIWPTQNSAPMNYVDGGISDNLPVDAVLDFLRRKAESKRISRRPATPHLLLTVSLEPQPRDLSKVPAQELKEIAEYWPALLRRAQRLSFNKKIDDFANSQHDFRSILKKHGNAEPLEMPLDLEVVTVKPRWLCKTFAFHPMLGYKQADQAASIAHGCASTFVALSNPPSKWVDSWADGGLPPGSDLVSDVVDEHGDLIPQKRTDGRCHFRKDAWCPFMFVDAKTERDKTHREPDSGLHVPLASRLGFGPKTIEALQLIYEKCGAKETHRSRDPDDRKPDGSRQDAG